MKTLLDEHNQTRNQQLLELINRYDLTAEKLEVLLKAPAFTKENVLLYLNACTTNELAQLFYQTGLVKLSEIVDQQHQAHLKAQNEQQSTSSAPPGGSSETLPDS